MASRLHLLWKYIKKYLVVIIISSLLTATVVLVILGYMFHLNWTGLTGYTPPTSQYQRGKTLWDWMQLLFVPAIIALGAAWLAARQNHDLEIARLQHKNDLTITVDNQRETALQGYIDKMSELLLEKNLRRSQLDDEVRNIATVRTVTILPNLDPQRKRSVIKFLHKSELIKQGEEVINLMEADLREAKLSNLILVASELTYVDLAYANLSDAKLRKSSLMSSILYEANLCGADLSEAILFMTKFVRADLRKALLVKADLTGAWLMDTDLRDADLSEANLYEANLSKANLTGAKVTDEQLNASISLKDTIMPDGSIHS